MRRMSRFIAFVLLAAFATALFAGCAVQSTGTTGGEDDGLPDDPRLIYNELEEIDMDIANREEEIMAHKVEQQMEDGAEIRDAIRRLEMELYNLEGRKAALEERLEELKAMGKA